MYEALDNLLAVVHQKGAQGIKENELSCFVFGNFGDSQRKFSEGLAALKGDAVADILRVLFSRAIDEE